MAEDVKNDNPQFLGDPVPAAGERASMAVPPQPAAPASAPPPASPTQPPASPQQRPGLTQQPAAPRPPAPGSGQVPAPSPRPAGPHPVRRIPPGAAPIVRRPPETPQPYPIAGEIVAGTTAGAAPRYVGARPGAPRSSLPPRSTPPRPAAVHRPPPQTYRIEGLLCVFAAIAWAVAAQWVYSKIGTFVFFQSINAVARESNAAADATSSPRGAARPSQNTFSFFPPPPARAQPSRGTTDMGAALAGPGAPSRNPADATLARVLTFGEGTRVIWALLTYLGAGILTVCGLTALFQSLVGRLFGYGTLAFVVGASGAGVAIARYTRPVDYGSGVEGWLNWMQNMTQAPYAWAGFLFVGGLFALLLGLVALRPTSHARAWIVVAIYTMLAGTLLSLAGISVLQTYGGFPPMPAWVYVLVAAAQFLLGLVLAVALVLRPEPTGAPAR